MEESSPIQAVLVTAYVRKSPAPKTVTRCIFYFHPDPCGNDPIRRSYFSKGVAKKDQQLQVVIPT